MIWLDRPASRRVRAVLASTAVSIWLAGCGQSGNIPAPAPPAPPIAAKPDVIVTLDGAHHDCIVALYSEPQGSTISCDDVVPFVRDELRLASGSVYDLRTTSNVEDAGRAKVETALKNAGYRFIRGPIDPPPNPPR